MQEKRYLLNIEQMLEGSGRDCIFREAFARIDGERRQKVCALKNARAQAAGIGAGLLIQRALAEHMACPQAEQRAGQSEWQERSGGSEVIEKPALERFSMEELLSVLNRKVTEPHYRYGKHGKPYLADQPFLFNLSHSGDYVFCGVSKQEIGVDIQKIQGDCGLRLARRFFADAECQVLESCEDEELRRRIFFRMWVRKEAYGKLTGEGIAGTVGKCFWSEAPVEDRSSACAEGKSLQWGNELIWEEYDEPDGYRMAVCRSRRETCVEMV